MCVSSINFVGLTEKCDKKFNVLEFERKKIEGINKHQQPDSITHDTSTYWPCVDQVSTLCASHSLRKERSIFFYIWKLERKKNEEIKGRVSKRNLVLSHIKQQMIHNTCTKLQNLMCNSSREIFVTNFPTYYIGVRDGKKGERRQDKSQFCFLSHNILGHLNVYTKFEDSGSHRS